MYKTIHTFSYGILLTAVIGVSFEYPLQVHAQFTTIESPGPLLIATAHIAAADSVTATNVTTQTVIKQVLDGLAWTVAKVAVQSITRSTVNWINSGFSGSPAFVSDLNENLGHLSDAVADNFINNLNQVTYDTTGFNIKTPFQTQLNQQLRSEYYRATSYGAGRLGLNQYDLQGQSKDPAAFLGGDFSQGGFNAFFSAGQNPANNPFGAYVLANNALWGSIDAAAQKRKTELGWGKGFLPWRGTCQEKAQSAIVAQNTATNKANTSDGEDFSTTVDTDDPSLSFSAKDEENLSQSEKCLNNTVRTPGSVIESQLEGSLGTGIRQLELADSINEIVGALAGQLVNQVLGPGGLLGASQPAAGGGQSYIYDATGVSQFEKNATDLASGVLQNIQNDRATATTYRDNWQKVLTAAQAAQTSCTDIGSVITKAQAGVAKGNAALAKISQLETAVKAAMQSTAVTKTTEVTAAATAYQSYLTSSSFPSSAEQREAADAASDTDALKKCS